jgi:hypothetical protein
LSVIVLLRFSLIAAQRSLATLRAILSQGISQVTTPRAPRPPAHRRGLMHLDVSTMRPLAERRYPDGAPSGVGAGSSPAFLRTRIDDISLLLYASLARAGARPHALNRGLLCHRAARSALETRLSGQRHSCIGVIFTHSRVVCRSPFLRSSRSPRPLPCIANHRSAPSFPPMPAHPFAIRRIC